MNDQGLLLARILDACRHRGVPEAVQLTRTAFEAGQLAAVELPEILLALRRGDLHALGVMTAPPASPPLGAARAA